MADASTNLGRQLADVEQISPAARGHYDEQLRGILEERIGVAARVACVAIGIVSIVFGAGLALAVFGDDEAYGYWPNLLLGATGTLTAFAIGAALIGVATQGVYRRHREGRWAIAGACAMLATWGIYMLLAAYGVPDSLQSTFMMLGLVCLGAAVLIAERLSRTRTQLLLDERLLELEHRLAEIADRLPRTG